VKLKLKYTVVLFLLLANVIRAQEINYSLAVRPANCNMNHDGEVEVNVLSSSPPYTYLWNFGKTDPVVRGLPPGDYTVTVTDATGYDTVIHVNVPANGGLCSIVPEQVFTPNDDGYNDSWYIDNIERYPDNKVLVFNRWGQKVFEQEGNYVPWNGMDLLGVPVPDNAYYYIIYGNKNDETTIVKGSVSIIR